MRKEGWFFLFSFCGKWCARACSGFSSSPERFPPFSSGRCFEPPTTGWRTRDEVELGFWKIGGKCMMPEIGQNDYISHHFSENNLCQNVKRKKN